ncbi:MAG: MATE family efflux transporter [Bacteroidaceae bacterium]|nr:MATE family efflux transporter [Bacteroidaceae bacterium]
MSQETAPTTLGTESIRKLLMQYAGPAIIAMTASSLYNMVDSIFIGQGVGALAISGLAITFPVMNLSAAFGAMVGVGASTLLSVKLGQKDYATAQNILGNVITLNTIIGVIFGVLMLAFINPILYFFGASDATISYARDYMVIILLGNVITHMYLGLNAMLRSAGHPQKAMYATIGTVIINTILDPLFIYTFNMGIQGAAVATVLAQTLALCWQLKLFSNKNEMIHLRRGTFALKKKIVSNSLAIGMAPFLMNLCSCFIVILINKGLQKHGGDLAIGAYGITNRVVFFFVMIVMGINQGMQPIAGYNYGARQFDRVHKVLRLTILAGTVVTTLAFLSGEFIPELLARAFTSDEELIHQSASGMRIMVAMFPIVGFQMVTTNFFQSIGKAKMSIFLSLTRQLIFLIPMLYIFPFFYGQKGVWLAMPISDLLSSLVAGFMLIRQFQEFKKHR